MRRLEIDMFAAESGDSFLIKCERDSEKTNIVVDMGYTCTYQNILRPKFLELSKLGESISLLIITHVDQDHIQGGIKFLQENGTENKPKVIGVEEIWHNSLKHVVSVKDIQIPAKKSAQGIPTVRSACERKRQQISYLQGSSFASYIYEGGYKWNEKFCGNAVLASNSGELSEILLKEGIKIIILSPTDVELSKLEQEWKRTVLKDTVLDGDIDDAFEYMLYRKGQEQPMRRRNPCAAMNESLEEYIAANPSIDDSNIVNGSSIAFILEFDEHRVVFLGDAHPTVICQGLDKYYEKYGRVKFDAVKISHHGSKGNTNDDLLNRIESDYFLISANGHHGHPDKETIVRLLLKQQKSIKKLVFSYKPRICYDLLNNPQMQEKYNFEFIYTNTCNEKNTTRIIVGNE